MNKAVDPKLRLSAMVAFLGRIHDCMRLVKVRESDGWIILSVIVSEEPDEDVIEDISEAGTEIVASFPDKKISERVEVSTADLPREDILASGWIFCRAERRTE